MAVVSVRLNREDYFHEDKSSLFKKSMFELYEDIQDIKFIEEHIAKRKEREFISGEELLA